MVRRSLSTHTSLRITVSSSSPLSTMLLPVRTPLLALILSSLVSGDDARKCRNDACLRCFERNHVRAERYCANHPNKFLMAPAPFWADECHSLGRMNNKRQRLASACSCLYTPEATIEVAYLAEEKSSIAVSTISSTAISVIASPSATSTSNVAAATSTPSSSGIPIITSEDAITYRK